MELGIRDTRSNMQNAFDMAYASWASKVENDLVDQTGHTPPKWGTRGELIQVTWRFVLLEKPRDNGHLV